MILVPKADASPRGRAADSRRPQALRRSFSASTAITAPSARVTSVSAAGSSEVPRSFGVWYVSNGTGRRIACMSTLRTGLSTKARSASASRAGTIDEPVRRHAGRRERAVIAAEHGDAPHLVPVLVAAEPEILERAAHAAQERRLLADVPDGEAVADAAQLQAQHAGDPRRRRRRGRTRARRGSRAPRRPGTGTARAATAAPSRSARASRWSRIADRRRVVVGAGAARHRVVMRDRARARDRPVPTSTREVLAAALEGRRRRARVYGTPRALRNRATAASRAALSRPSSSRESASGSSLAAGAPRPRCATGVGGAARGAG